jgi:hypothetical protein
MGVMNKHKPLRNSYSIKPFIELTLPKIYHLAVGPCPHCGRLDTWLNNVPLTAYCGGDEDKPHKEWEKVIPSPYNPYLSTYDSLCVPNEIEYEDRRLP